MTELGTPDELSLRLAAIVDELAALPDGPSPERYRLLTERDSLRSRAADLKMAVDEARSIESLNAELTSLTRQRTEMLKTRGGYVTGDSADSAGRVGASLTQLGSHRGSSEVERLTVRITRIEDVLTVKDGQSGD